MERPAPSTAPSIPISIPTQSTEVNADEAALIALGYKQEFRRDFSLWTMFCVSFAALGLLPSFASTLSYGMGNAGTGGMIWGWIISWLFIQCVAMGIAELCSSMPTSGGLYYAAAVLAPPGYGPLAAWITGWSNWMAQITAAPSANYALSAMMLAAASITHPAYVPQDWQVFLLTVLIMLIHATISSMPTIWIARYNTVSSILNMLALLLVILIIPCSVIDSVESPRFLPSRQAWSLQNGTEWPDGMALLMSFMAIIWIMGGFDLPFHLSEECSNAAVASPRAIVLTSGIGGFAGWALQLVVAYTIKDVGSVIGSDLGQPWAAYLIQVMPQQKALAILALTISCSFSVGQGCMLAASRLTFAYARDGCFPVCPWIKRVNKLTLTPVNAVWFNMSIGICLLTLIFGGPVAIGAIFSVGAIATYIAFVIPIFIRVFFVGERFRRGPWNLGKFGKPVGMIACAFILVMVPILCFPSVRRDHLTGKLMNWTVVVYGAPMLIVMTWWILSARKWFKGPKVNVNHLMFGRRDPVLHGVDMRPEIDGQNVAELGLKSALPPS